MEKLTLTVAELAQQLGIGRNAAYELCNRSDFPSVRIGKRFLVPVVMLNEWLRGQAQEKDIE